MNLSREALDQRVIGEPVKNIRGEFVIVPAIVDVVRTPNGKRIDLRQKKIIDCGAGEFKDLQLSLGGGFSEILAEGIK